MMAAKLRLAMAGMGKRETNVGALCDELGITRQTLYRHVAPTGHSEGTARKFSASRGFQIEKLCRTALAT